MQQKQANRTILVVEDDLAIGGFLSMGLEDAGYTVQVISNGAVALNAIQQTLPALILLDFQLPSLSGDQILRRMRASNALRTIPVIVISAFRELPEVVETYAQAILWKPFALDQLLDLIALWVPPTAE
jgi:DNA-binding response OmpR family regulator